MTVVNRYGDISPRTAVRAAKRLLKVFASGVGHGYYAATQQADGVIEGLLNDGPRYKADLADILIVRSAHAAGCEGGLTFDKNAARLPFFALLQ